MSKMDLTERTIEGLMANTTCLTAAQKEVAKYENSPCFLCMHAIMHA